MYWEYSIAAIAVILLISYGTLLYLKKKGKADSASKVNLFFSTVIAVGFALLIPIFAKTLSGALNTATFTAILLALLIGLFMGVGFGVMAMTKKKAAAVEAEHSQEETPEENVSSEDMPQDMMEAEDEIAVSKMETPEAVDLETLVEPESNHQEAAHSEKPAEDEVQPISDNDASIYDSVTDDDIYALGDMETFRIKTHSETLLEEPLTQSQSVEDILPDSSATEASNLSELPSFDMEDKKMNEVDEKMEAFMEIDDEMAGLEQKMVDTGGNTDRIGIEEKSAPKQAEIDNEDELALKLLEAFDHRSKGRISESISCLSDALSYKLDSSLSTQIIIEICSLSKKLNNTQIILELLVSEKGDLLDPAIKEDILSNI